MGGIEDITGIDWALDLEARLVERYGWSIYEMDQTDVESLMLFVHRLTADKSGARTKRVYIDQVSGLL